MVSMTESMELTFFSFSLYLEVIKYSSSKGGTVGGKVLSFTY